MRRWSGVLIVVGLLASAVAARADTVALYLQGQGGYGNSSPQDQMPDGAQGGAFGIEGGVRAFFLDAYVNRDAYLHGGTVTRAILGVEGDYGLIGWRVSLRLGAGLLYQQDGALDGMTAGEENGLVGRVGAGLDKSISPRFLVGIGLEGEYFQLRPSFGDGTQGSRSGTDVLATLRVSCPLTMRCIVDGVTVLDRSRAEWGGFGT
jgi:hypothetical protein